MAHTQNHTQVILLSHVLRLRILIAAGTWADVGATIQLAEAALGLSYEPASTPKPRLPATGKENETIGMDAPNEKEKAGDRDEFISFEDPFEAAMVVHTIMMAVVYYTHVGSAAEAAPRLSHLHALLDSGALDKFPDGSVNVRVVSRFNLVHTLLMVGTDQACWWSTVESTSHASAYPFPARFPCERGGEA